jgi:hypothetical protein
MSTIPSAKMISISSPYARYGQTFEMYRRYYGQDNPNVLVWKAATRMMNPNITQQFVDDAMAEDAEAARSEYLAEWREDIEQAFSLESIESCVISGRTDLLPAQGITYSAFVDPSGGSHDQFTLAVGHRKGDVAIVDLVKAFPPPFVPSEIVQQCAEALKPYRVRNVVGDAFGGEFPREHFRKHNITYQLADKNRSQLYLNLIPTLNSKRVELPDHKKLIDELRRLERRRGRSGRDSIDHPQYAGSDDIANAVAGVVDMIIQKPVMSANAMPIGVGKVVNPFSSTLDKPLPGSTFGDSDDDYYIGGVKPIR